MAFQTFVNIFQALKWVPSCHLKPLSWTLNCIFPLRNVWELCSIALKGCDCSSLLKAHNDLKQKLQTAPLMSFQASDWMYMKESLQFGPLCGAVISSQRPLCGMLTGTTSLARMPDSHAALLRVYELMAKASCSSREMLLFLAVFSAQFPWTRENTEVMKEKYEVNLNAILKAGRRLPCEICCRHQ